MEFIEKKKEFQKNFNILESKANAFLKIGTENFTRRY
jgi:hypothetical protein